MMLTMMTTGEDKFIFKQVKLYDDKMGFLTYQMCNLAKVRADTLVDDGGEMLGLTSCG